MAVKELSISEFAGGNTGWGGTLPLRNYSADEIHLDLRALRFVVPTFLLRLRAFVEWHQARGRRVRVRCPTRVGVNHYLARMRINDGLPAGTFHGLRAVSEHDQSDVLVPIKQLRQLHEVDHFAVDLAPVVSAHVSDEIAAVAQPFISSVSELGQNAVEHGENPLGCFVAAQRYRRSRSLALAVADLGLGVPSHLRAEYPDLPDDAEAIKLAVREGISGTGSSERGYGLAYVLDEVQAAATVPWARMTIRSGYGEYTVNLRGDNRRESLRGRGFKRGTWVSFEFGTRG